MNRRGQDQDRDQQRPGLTDEHLEAVVVAATEGHGWAIGALYRELHPPLVAYLKAQEPRAGEDLASDTWLKIAAGLPSFRGGPSEFRSWAFTIARCRLVDHRRKCSRRRDVIDLDALAARPAVDDPEAEAMSAVTAEAALGIIAGLSADQADVVLLRVVAGLETTAVARIMGKPVGTVRVLQHRALRRLAGILEPNL